MKEKINNPRRTFHTDIECVPEGYANGKATNAKTDKKIIIKNAADAFGRFLDALGCNWQDDPNSMETPMRVAKAYVNDLWKGRFEDLPDITSFPSDGYDGIVIERNIPITSMCSHHHQTIAGVVHVGYGMDDKGYNRNKNSINTV